MHNIRNMKKSLLATLVGISLVFVGCTLPVKRVVVPDPPVEPYEFIPYGHFDGIEVDENNLPKDQRHIGSNMGEVYVDDREARSGTHSLYIEGTGGSQANGFGVLQSFVSDLPAGETYKFTLWFRAPEALAAGVARGIHARIQGSTNIRPWDPDTFEPMEPGSQYDWRVAGADGHLLYITPLVSARQDLNDPTDWHPLSATFSVPEDAGDVNLIINIYNETNYPVWIDDLSLLKL